MVVSFSHFRFTTYKKITKTFETAPFAYDTGIIIANPNPLAFMNEIKKVLKIYIYEWFIVNLLSLNIEKTYFMQFSSKNRSLTNLNIIMIK